MIAFHCWGICKHSDDQIWDSYMYGENIWKGKEHGNKGTFEKVATGNKENRFSYWKNITFHNSSHKIFQVLPDIQLSVR